MFATRGRPGPFFWGSSPRFFEFACQLLARTGVVPTWDWSGQQTRAFCRWKALHLWQSSKQAQEAQRKSPVVEAIYWLEIFSAVQRLLPQHSTAPQTDWAIATRPGSRRLACSSSSLVESTTGCPWEKNNSGDRENDQRRKHKKVYF